MTIPALPPRAWLIVGLLWLVACLNYIDRVMIATMRGSLVAAVPMTDAQFGLLTAVFLWVYASFSPFAGFMADRFKRSHVIIGSLLVWSVVTWMTSFATTFNQLLITRGLMGISEAFYVPAALALISDYHQGATRSRATGVHMTGMMIGASLGGLGGWVAERHTWNYAFSFFGLVGICYVFVLALFLRDRPRAPQLVDAPVAPPVRLGAAFSSLLRSPSFLLAFVYWGALGVLWTIVGWMPTYLTEKFQLKQGNAGFSATGYLQAAAMVGVLIGGYWADVWSRKNPRARLYVPMIGLAVAGPALLFVAHTDILLFAILGLTLHGLFRAFTDANMMPVLCMIADPRYRATGYGLLNLCACFVGGVSIYAGGWLRDRGVSLVHLFEFAGCSLLFCIFLLLFIRTEPVRAEMDKAAPELG